MKTKRAELAILWSFVRQSKSYLPLCIALMFCACVFSWKWPLVGNSSLTYLFFAVCWVWTVRSCKMLTSHHWTLPLSNKRLAALSFAYAFLVPALLCLLTLGGLNALGASWLIPEAVVFTGMLSIMALVVSTFFPDEMEKDGQESFVVVLVGVWFVGLIQVNPNPLILLGDFVHQLRWPLMLGVVVCSWGLLLWRVNRLRLGKTWQMERLRHFDVRFGDLRRSRLARPKTPAAAINELDWRRVEEMMIMIAGTIVFVMLPLSWLVRPDVLFGIWMYLGGMALFGMSIGAYAFMDFESKQNGAFRWTLPVSDKELAYGLLRALFKTLVIGACLWLAGLAVVATVAWWRELPVLPELYRGAKPKEAAMLIGIIAIAGVVISWIHGAMTLVGAIIGGCRGTIITLAMVALPFAILLVQQWIPEAYRRAFVQLAIAGVGLLMMASTWRVFRYARDRKFMSDFKYRMYLVIWLLLLPCCAFAIMHAELGIGTVIFAGGILSLAFHPLASMPLVVSNARHYWSNLT